MTAPGLSDGALLDLPRRSAELTPDKVAVRAGDRVLTYRQLEERAAQIADRLTGLDLPENSTIGIQLGPTVELPVALLAVMRAGHSWLPLPSADAAPPPYPVVARITDGFGGAPRNPTAAAPTVSLDDRDHDRDSITADRSRARHESPDRTAGVLPGIDGAAPVPVGRAALARRLRKLADTWRTGPGDRFLIIAPTTAHGMVDMLLALTCGGELVLPDRTDVRDIDQLARLVEDCRPRFLHTTPAVWYRLLESGLTGGRRLTAIVSGAPLPLALARRLAEATAETWQVYGVAESAYYATMHRFAPDQQALTVPIGRPLDGMTARLLDPDLRPVADGEVGELYLTGDGLTDGYPDRPSSCTAERFVPDPTPERPGARAFRTGELARLTPDGTLEDRGPIHRHLWSHLPGVSAFDIEQRLLGIGDVGQCAITGQSDPEGRPLLVVHLVLNEQRAGDTEAVFEAVAKVLSDYPLDHRLLLRSFLPLTDTGMIDYLALSAPVSVSAPQGRPLSTPEERTIARIWADLLDIPEPPADVSFFEVGGYSLATTRLANRMEESFELHVPIAELFTHTTVTEQAELIERLYDQQLDDLSDLDDLSEEDGRFSDPLPVQ